MLSEAGRHPKNMIFFRRENTVADGLWIRGVLKTSSGVERYLNGTAADIVELYLGGLGVDEIVEVLAGRYDAPVERIRADVAGFVGGLGAELGGGEARVVGGGVPAEPLEWFLRAPLTLFLELTYRCNLGCRHCYASAGRAVEGELGTGEVYGLLEEAAEMGVVGVALGGGEPLLREDFLDIVGRAVRLGLWVEFSTNGFFLGGEVLDGLARLGVLWVQVSLEGGAAVNDAIRSPGSFDAAVEAIRRAKERGFSVTVRTTVQRGNIERLGEMLELLRGLGVDTWFLAQVIPSGRALEDRGVLVSSEEYGRAVEEVRAAARGRPRVIGGVSGGLEVGGGAGGRAVCRAGFSILSVTPRGLVKPCPYFPDRFSDGSVRERGLREIWYGGRVLGRLRRLRRRDLWEPCRSCVYRCGGGCRAAAASVYGSVEAPDPLCGRVGWARV